MGKIHIWQLYTDSEVALGRVRSTSKLVCKCFILDYIMILVTLPDRTYQSVSYQIDVEWSVQRILLGHSLWSGINPFKCCSFLDTTRDTVRWEFGEAAAPSPLKKGQAYRV